jgi:mRNA interferase RelE/StbE
MNYTILILRRVQKELSDLPESVYIKVKMKIQKMAFNPRPRGSRKLSGREGCRIRVGDYRIIYEIDDTNHSVTILNIGNRKDIYR